VSRTYLLNLFRTHRVLLLAGFLFVCGFQVVVLALVGSAGMLEFIQNVFRQMPLPAQQFFGADLMARFTASGAVALGYSHPFVLVMTVFVAILLPTRHIAGEIEAGTLELVLSMPVRRSAIGLSLWVGGGLALLLLTSGCWLGTALGLLLYPEIEMVDTSLIVKLGLNLWLLLFAICSYTLLISAFQREAGAVAQRAVVVTLLFYFLYYAIPVWPEAEFLSPFTIFHYYQPQKIMQGEPIWVRNVAVLSSLILITAAASIVKLVRRDIPG